MRMKKFLIFIMLLVSTVTAALAVPPGSYVDNRGKLKIIVHQNGTEAYYFNNNGQRILTYEILGEYYDSDKGVYVVRVRVQGQNTEVPACYWKENGEVYFNISTLCLHLE